MISKREILKHIVETKGLCKIDNCKDCPYWKNNLCRKIKVVGAMAILRMFRKKKKPLLSVGTKIRFEDGEVAKLEDITDGKDTLVILRFKDGRSFFLSYLVGKIWELAE